MLFETESFFVCPYCSQRVSMVFEELYGSQSYIEDCEVCCNPIQVSYVVEEGLVTSVTTERAQ